MKIYLVRMTRSPVHPGNPTGALQWFDAVSAAEDAETARKHIELHYDAPGFSFESVVAEWTFDEFFPVQRAGNIIAIPHVPPEVQG